MTEKDAAPHRTAEKRIYDGKILNLRVDDVKMPSGRTAKREVVEHRDAVGIIALTDRGTTLLVRQNRYAVGEDTIEICAGLIDDGEDKAEAARREMREELGLAPSSIKEVGGFYSSPGFCTEFMTLFLAEGLTKAPLPQDEDENVSAAEVNIAELPRMMADGAFRDAKTFAAMAWLMAREGIEPIY